MSNDPKDKVIGAGIRRRRNELGLSLHQLEAKTSIPVATLEAYEDWEMPVLARDLHSLAVALETGPERLLGGLSEMRVGIPRIAVEMSSDPHFEASDVVSAYFALSRANRDKLLEFAKKMYGAQLKPEAA